MQFSVTTAIALFLGLASAAPTELEIRGTPSNEPIDFTHLPDGTSFTCGKNTYSDKDLYLAAQRGVALQKIGETRGKNSYPHAFDHNDSKGHNLDFPSYCPEGDKNRQEFPLIKNGPYDGGKNNVKQGDERVVYYYDPQNQPSTGHSAAIFCGIMTHEGAATGGFLLC